MIDRIKSDEVLSKFIKESCSENGVEATLDIRIEDDNVVIISVDDYYNSLGLAKTPPSPDCLVVIKCRNSGYSLTIIELKDISNSKGFDLQNMLLKFSTCIDDFIKVRFKDLLYHDFKSIKLYFVSGVELYKRDIGLKMDALINKKFEYNGKKYIIIPRMPNPNIGYCY